PGRVQADRAMRVEHSLWVARRATRVAQRRRLALVELGVVELAGTGFLEQLLVAQSVGQVARVAVPHDYVVRHARQLSRERLERRYERVVHEDQLVLGVVDDVGELLLEQAYVERVQHRADARDRKVELKVTLAVPGEGADPISLL